MQNQGVELARACAKAAEEIKAEDIRILDLRGVSNLTDFMVVCSGTSAPHLRAIMREVSEKARESQGAEPEHLEGKPDTRWVVLDFIDVMVHVMDPELRDFYGLEDMWKDAKEVEWK